MVHFGVVRIKICATIIDGYLNVGFLFLFSVSFYVSCIIFRSVFKRFSWNKSIKNKSTLIRLLVQTLTLCLINIFVYEVDSFFLYELAFFVLWYTLLLFDTFSYIIAHLQIFWFMAISKIEIKASRLATNTQIC